MTPGSKELLCKGCLRVIGHAVNSLLSGLTKTDVTTADKQSVQSISMHFISRELICFTLSVYVNIFQMFREILKRLFVGRYLLHFALEIRLSYLVFKKVISV
jgi:hypothetical protein